MTKLNIISSAEIHLGAQSVPVVVPIKNEISLVGHFIDHYKRLGFSDFIFIDNGSTDGTLEYLGQFPDINIVQCLSSFREANYGMDWVNELIGKYCHGRWACFVDCDEFLVFPDCENTSINELCARYDAAGWNTVACSMVDMYPAGSFMHSKVPTDRSPLEVFNRFDADYVFRRWPRRFWDSTGAGFNLQVLGGPRTRVLTNLAAERRHGAYYYTLCNQVDRFIDHVPRSWIRTLALFWPMEPPAQQKRPLNFIGPNFSYSDNHTNNNLKLAGETVALLHLKLCDELQRRLSQPAIIENHYRRGLSYEQLRQALLRWGDRPLTYEGTREFRDSRDLERVGLIGPTIAQLWQTPEADEVVTPVEASDGRF